ncbi:methyltransferase family protein [candidate division CSSED10-310 bacterium]|uniref:Methyltransferase family protein n=1 Tax=candidate division CSSED10-310 bacterium TaxID=2855610 RepID=A0ABV6Z0F1_UNCC1
MALREHFEQTGNLLFKVRSYMPILLLVIFLLALNDYEYLNHSYILDQIWKVFCLIISFAGLGFRILTIGFTPRGTSGRNVKGQIADELNTTGLYSVIRHPLYFGNFFICLGISMFFHIWWICVIYILIFWLYYERIMFAEEEFLRKKFGTEFFEWTQQTHAFWPVLKNYRENELEFSLKKVLKQEYSGFFSIIVTFALLEVLGNFYLHGKFELNLMWIFILTVGFIIYLTIAILRKTTKLLSFTGR